VGRALSGHDRHLWAEFVPFLAFPVELRKIVYSTNFVESLNARLRRDVYLRWTMEPQALESLLEEIGRDASRVDEGVVRMRRAYWAYNELSLLDCPRELVAAAAWVHKQQHGFLSGGGNPRNRVGKFLIKIKNRMQADLDRAGAGRRRRACPCPQERFSFEHFQ
jgi:hypothetical protein